MDRLIDLSYEIDALWKTSIASGEYHIESPAWIKWAFVINQHISHSTDNFTDLFCTDLTTDLQNALYVELSSIYKKKYFQQKSANCFNLSAKYMFFKIRESCVTFR